MPVTLTLPVSEAIGTLLRIGLIVLLVLLAERALRLASRQIGQRLEATVAEPEQLARLKTLLRVGQGTVVVLMVIIAGMMVLYTLGINVTPLLVECGGGWRGSFTRRPGAIPRHHQWYHHLV